jgi:RHS repeat-associated protein
MKRFILAIVFYELGLLVASGQVFDTTFTASESATKSHYARNSIVLGPGYSYTPSGGNLTIGIQNAVVTGSTSYISPVDPETRTLNSSYQVGTTQGTLDVDQMGNANYTIPIQTLPGVNGLAPNLALIYSSGTGPGIAGYGWEISGLSSISRGPKTMYHDGSVQGIEMNTSDRFYLDGQRLINSSGTYGANNTEYRTESDIFTRVTTQGTVGSGSEWFLAETKSGLKYEYGHTSGSKQQFGITPIIWYVSKISDLFGNYIRLSYLYDNNCIYPAEITYGPNIITFYYKRKTEEEITYLKGNKIEQCLVLDKIVTKYNAVIVKTYEFKYNYQLSLLIPHTQLNEVIEYGTGSQRFNSTAISYQLPSNFSFGQTAYNTTHAYITYQSKLFTGDINGDGKSDFICFPDASKGATWTGMRVYFGDGHDGFTTYYSETSPIIDPSHLLDMRPYDINADGKDELVYEIGSTNSSSFYYRIYTGSGFLAPSLISTINTTPNPNSGIEGKTYRISMLMEKDNEWTGSDFNGDGVNDILITDPNGNWILKSFGDGQGGLSASLNTLGYGNNPIFMNSGYSVQCDDFNGDGKADLFYKGSNGQLIIYSFIGTTFFGYTPPSFDLPYAVLLGDFNADGKVDLFAYGQIVGTTVYEMDNWQIWLSTGTDFDKYVFPKKKSNIKDDYVRMGDFNGDGATDLMVTSKNKSWTGTYFYIAKNNGTDFAFSSLPAYPDNTHNFYLADYNGDGRTDFLCTDGLSPWWNGYQIYKTLGNTTLLANKIGNGLGKIVKIAYTKLSEAPSSIYQKSSGATYPMYDFQGPVTIVDTIKIDNGLGSFNFMSYKYEGAKFHLHGKGLVSYSKITKKDFNLGIENQDIYSIESNYRYPQLVKNIILRSGTTDTISKITNTWAHLVLDAPNKRIFPYIQKSVILNKLKQQSVNTTTSFDNYGNPNIITTDYNDGHTVTVTNTYSNFPILWLLGRPTSTLTQYSGYDTAFSRTVNRAFDTKNNILLETAYPGTSMEINHVYKYNSNGTLKRDSVFAGSVYRITVYKYQSSDGIRLEKITDALSHTKEFTYYTNGRLNTEKDYLNNIITYQYDELGRQTQRSTTFGDQLTTLYAWENISGSPRYSIQSSGNDGSLKKDYYDRLERIVQSDLKGFSGSMISTLTQYNALGQLYRISEPGSSTDWNVYSYNLYGQISGITRPSGRNSTWTYSSATTTETTGGKSFSKTYNSAGLLMTATDNGGTIIYSYLPNGATKTITAPGNIITRIKYDYADNQIKLIDPSAGTILYSYNAFKELIRQENNRNQVTTIVYYNDGRINHKDTPEAIATYNYDNSKNLVRIKLSTGINKIFKYDSKGRIISHCDSIGNVVLRDSITYDNLGRVLTIKHPSNIIESKYYNSSGYPDHVDAGGSTRWRINNMNSRLQIGSATYGSNLSETYTYDTYGYLTQVYTMNGMATIRDSRYSFNPVTQNLSWRKNALSGVNKQENFYYDNLDRLDSIRQGTITTLDLAYEPNKGGLIRKTDIGTLNYNLTSKPYALSSINPSTGIIPSSMNDSLSYTSFETVNVILEDIYKATFTYNSDNQRAKMVILKNNLAYITRWYFGNSYIREDSCGVIREYTYIAGNGYNAPVLTKKQGGIVSYYYLLRDHLGSITHVLNSINAVLKEYSYDAWGRMRNPTTWTICAPGIEPYLFGGRGYTGHEHLTWFKLINMNGRLYDPLTAQFLSVDNYIQNTSFTQNFNRFGYCFNNPLKYTDPTGYYSYPVDQENRRGPLGPDKEFADLDLYGNAISNSGLGSGYRKSMIANCPHISEWKSQQYHYDYYWGRYVNFFGEEVDYETAVNANLRSYGGINITDPLAIMKFVLKKIIYPALCDASYQTRNNYIQNSSYIVEGILPKLYYVYEDETPDIFDHTVDVLKYNPQWYLLQYNGGGDAKERNRKRALRGVNYCDDKSTSRDEFPYASTEQGGKNAWVRCVPIDQQNTQSNNLRRLYSTMNKGDWFIVIPVKSARNRIPQFEPVPYPFPIPVIAPELIFLL